MEISYSAWSRSALMNEFKSEKKHTKNEASAHVQELDGILCEKDRSQYKNGGGVSGRTKQTSPPTCG